jgi:hypothetical protein
MMQQKDMPDQSSALALVRTADPALPAIVGLAGPADATLPGA